MTKNFYSFILKSEIRGYKRTFASQFWIFWACFVYFFLISPGNTFEKRQQKQRLAFFSKLCWDENHNIKPDLIAKSQNIPLFIKKNTAKTKQLFKSDYNINEKKFLLSSGTVRYGLWVANFYRTAGSYFTKSRNLKLIS